MALRALVELREEAAVGQEADLQVAQEQVRVCLSSQPRKALKEQGVGGWIGGLQGVQSIHQLHQVEGLGEALKVALHGEEALQGVGGW